MVTLTPGPERWFASVTRRTSARTSEQAGVRASSAQKSEQSGVKRDARGRFISIRSSAGTAAAIAAPTGTPGTIRRRAPRRRPTKNVDLCYEPFAKQQEFHASPAKYRLFGGAAGPGKSKALLMEAILQAHETPGAQTLLLRRTFPELEQSLLFYFRRDVPRELYKSFNESKHVVEWQNGSTTRFGYCQNESDVYQYQGSEFLFIGIDELTLFTLRQWQFLTSRNRCPVRGSFPCMAAATNPGNIGHAWVKSLWIDRQPPSGMEDPGAYDPADYDFIPARVSDNPIYRDDEQYLKTLRALPSHLRRAFLDGDWDVFAGQYFDKFDHSRHVARAEQIDWKPWWQRWISIDWGFEHPSAAYWHAAVPPGSTSRGTRDVSPVGAQHAVPGAALSHIDNVHDRAGETSSEYGGASPSTIAGHSSAVPLQDRQEVHRPAATSGEQRRVQDDDPGRIVTYREYVTHRTPPRELARQIIERSLHSGDVATSAGFVGAQHAAPGADAWLNANYSVTVSGGVLPGIRNPEESAGGVGAPNGSAQPSTFAGRSSAAPGADAWRNANYSATVSGGVLPGIRNPENSAGGAGAPNGSARPSTFAGRSSAAPLQDQSTEREKIDAIYLSPDAFARRTDEASIADQMGDVFVAAGFPRPIPADNDRVGGWMLMYQMLESGEWLLTDNCIELIRTLPNLVRDPARIEDVEKMDGDDPADAARYGLKSRYGAHHGGSGGRMPLAARLAERVTSADPTVRAIQARKAQLEESQRSKPVSFLHRHR